MEQITIPDFLDTFVWAVIDRSGADSRLADAQAPAEQDPSRDRALAAAETDVAEGNPGDRRLQDVHLAADDAARLEPQALDLDDRARAATRPDAVGNPRGVQTGTLRQDVADERPARVGAGSAHAAADTALLLTPPRRGTDAAPGVVALVTRMDSHAGAPARSAASSRRRMSSGVRLDAPPSRYTRGVMCSTPSKRHRPSAPSSRVSSPASAVRSTRSAGRREAIWTQLS